ncbi:carbon-nitrogen hydrolase family protein [Desulfotruncus alcoholivorax]|uniref:carbon-nitrogen hydrolase family protein n=1 Tax=Desulfotruncus alcoholivorax TaxID=265477 RepID=UPI000486D352|nr:carbon-nitrogen hydrolase family protein [Desulfotruncus alcoholivorax]
MEQGPFQIAVVQAGFACGEADHNLDKMKKIIHSCREQHRDMELILFPELSATGYNPSLAIRQLAEMQTGPIFQVMAESARSHNVHVGYGYVELGEGGRVFNSIILIGPDGQLLANYRKMHLTVWEQGIFDPGRDFVTVDTKLGRIGLMICWDLAFPEMARVLAVNGAELLLAPSAWEKPYDLPYRRFSMARAIDNTVFLATCNQVGVAGNLDFFGLSGIYGPDGDMLASAGADIEDVIVANIDPGRRLDLQKSFFSMMLERRTELYALKVEMEV